MKTYLYKRTKEGRQYISYRRRVPTDLVGAFQKKIFIISLQTDDDAIARSRSSRISKQFERNIALARSGNAMEPYSVVEIRKAVSRKESAIDLIEKFLGAYRDHESLSEEEHDFMFHMLSEYVENERGDIDPQRVPVVKDAFSLLSGKDVQEDWPLSMVIEKFLELDDRATDRKFLNVVKVSLKDWADFTGDQRLSRLKRHDVSMFIKHYDERGLTRATAHKRISMLRMAIKKVNEEFEINLNNPFLDVKVKINEPRKIVEALDTNQEILIKEAPNTEVGLLLKILYGTGMRISECAGLALVDVFLDHNIPHVFIRANQFRRIKNRSSERKIPLVGISLEAMRSAVINAKGNDALFARWIKNGKLSDTPSNSLIKGTGIKSHSLRHNLTTMLREAETHFETSELILGHSMGSSETQFYGDGSTLATKQAALAKVIRF